MAPDKVPVNDRAIEPAARLLEAALVFNFVIHAVAMASMALLLLPGMPGGGVTDGAERAGTSPNIRCSGGSGWFPWQLTALADLALGVALVRTKWIPRKPACSRSRLRRWRSSRISSDRCCG